MAFDHTSTAAPEVAQPTTIVYIRENPQIATSGYNPPYSEYQDIDRNFQNPTTLSNALCIVGGIVTLAGAILLIIGNVEIDKGDNCSSAACCSGSTCIVGPYSDNCYCCSGDWCPSCPYPYVFTHDTPSCDSYEENNDLITAGIVLIIAGPILFCCPVSFAMCFNIGRGIFYTND